MKFEDYCDRVPHFTRLNSYLPNSDKLYRGAEYLAMELTVLKLIDWDLCVPTVAHFLPYFLKVAVDEDDLRNGMPISSKASVESYLEKHALYFQEICLQGKIYTVKPVLKGHSKIDKTKVLKTHGSLMKIESIAECSLGAFCNTFDLH